jgi:CheY-like chemotaxis protein
MAHDMNNVLGAILGLASTLHLSAEPGSPGDRSLDTIMKACLRGRGVVRSLLYFARKGLGEERPLELNALVTDMVQLLGSTTLQRVKLEMALHPGLPALLGDAGSVHNALMNLCINAVDAMPGGGTLHLETRLLADGSQELRVRDTGEGMSEVVLAKAMDPFFTSKAFGKGTGLGLSMAYGTMQAHEGRLELQSQVGVGTEAILRFPAARSLAALAPQSALPVLPVLPGPPPAGSRSLDILLVDDDDLVRAALAAMLEALGHRVTPAEGGQQALQILATDVTVDLVLLDMNMPDMNGAQSLPRILSLRPDLPVLLDSGHGPEEVQPLLAGRPNVRSIMKPFNLKELQAKLEEMDLTRRSEQG